MAKKSKTQKARASAVRAQKKADQELQVSTEDTQAAETQEADTTKKKFSFKKKESSPQAGATTPAKKEAKKPSKKRFAFFSDVRAELRRVTWPTKQDVLRWSAVVVVALIFFGLYTFLLDNFVVTPLLVNISGLGA